MICQVYLFFKSFIEGTAGINFIRVIKVLCRSELPYPKVRVERPNREYAKLLLEDYAGMQSEDTAIHLYLYQSFLKSEELEEFARVMSEIAKVEMHHFMLLGKTISLLGVDPVYGTISRDEYFMPWNTSSVSYAEDLRVMLETDIIREEEAIRNYEKHKSSIDDKYIKELISRIIEDEKIHLAIFHNFYQKFFY